MAKNNPLNRAGAVDASNKVGVGAVAGATLGKLGQAVLGTQKAKLGLMMQAQRFNQRKELFNLERDERDRREKERQEYGTVVGERIQNHMMENPNILQFDQHGNPVKIAAAPTIAKYRKKTTSPGTPKSPRQGPTQEIIALRKAHEAGDPELTSLPPEEQITHENAMGHKGYATAFNAHIGSGGKPETFLNNYTPMGYKSRKQNPGDNRNEAFNSGGNA